MAQAKMSVFWFWHSAGETVLLSEEPSSLNDGRRNDCLFVEVLTVRQWHVGGYFTPNYTAPLSGEEGSLWHYPRPSAKNSSRGNVPGSVVWWSVETNNVAYCTVFLQKTTSSHTHTHTSIVCVSYPHCIPLCHQATVLPNSNNGWH